MVTNEPGETEGAAPAAVIDLGTHSCLLLVGRSVGDGLEVLEDRLEVPALGEGLAASGSLGVEPMARALGVLGRFAERARELGAEPLAVGTAAMRRADNAVELVERARADLGLELRVLSGEDEARLAWRAAVTPGGDPESRVVDVGGGSVEVAAEGGRERRSFPLGAVLLSERLGAMAPWQDLVAAAREAMGVDRALFRPGGPGPAKAIGGTATNLAALALGLEVFDHRRVEGVSVPAVEVHRQGRILCGLGLEERRCLPIEAPRAGVLPAGLACLAAALELLEAEALEVTIRGLRHGLLEELLDAGRASGGSGADGT